MTDDAKPMSRHARWRLDNPDKVRNQRERRKKRLKGLLPPFERPPAKTPEETRAKRISRMKRYHEKRRKRMKEDPQLAEKLKDQARNRRLKNKPASVRTKMPKEERARRNRESKRRWYRLKHGIPLDAPVGYRKPKAPPKPKAIDQERARRAAEVEAAKALAALVKPEPQKAICPDPPELQELFRKASKGEPPRPFPAAGRKRSVFHLRGAY